MIFYHIIEHVNITLKSHYQIQPTLGLNVDNLHCESIISSDEAKNGAGVVQEHQRFHKLHLTVPRNLHMKLVKHVSISFIV